MNSINALFADSGHTAIHDPVPSTADDSWIFPNEGPPPHLVEREVQKALLNVPDAHFSSLQVRRLPDGICLTGVVRIDEGADPGLDELACQVAGVTRVLNHLVVQKGTPAGKPTKVKSK